MEVFQIYVETSIFGFCHETRQEPATVDKHKATLKWFDEQAPNYKLVIGESVIIELEGGDYPFKADVLKMLRGLPVLKDETGEIADIANVYLENRLMPKGKGKDKDGDAWHLAFASYYQCQYLLSWNCQHLANPKKLRHIRTINDRLRLSTPKLVTPDDLLEEAPNVRFRR